MKGLSENLHNDDITLQHSIGRVSTLSTKRVTTATLTTMPTETMTTTMESAVRPNTTTITKTDLA